VSPAPPAPLPPVLVRPAAPAWRAAALLAGALGLAGCAGRPPMAGSYLGGPVRLACVPFARALSGVHLRGDAAEWWDAAAGRYRRAHAPSDGSVLVFRATGRLPEGHLAVVTDVLGPRRILVADANWVPDRVTRDQPVIDVSNSNDWSLVRVYWPPARQMGATIYPVAGFIRPAWPASPTELDARTPAALRIALGPGG
jgi:CHAP domain